MTPQEVVNVILSSPIYIACCLMLGFVILFVISRLVSRIWPKHWYPRKTADLESVGNTLHETPRTTKGDDDTCSIKSAMTGNTLV